MAHEESKTAITSPPAGTGNVPGLGEAFNINLSTGQGVYSYKIILPDGIAGYTPTLNLEYSHGAGQSAFGLGWKLPLRWISRRLDFGVPKDGMEERFMDSGNDILPMSDGTYAARIESVFSRYLRVDEGWHIEDRNGHKHKLGCSSIARLSDPSHPERINEWLLEQSLDPSGNAIDYSYMIHEGTAYLSEVRYAIYAVRFNYEERPDPRLNGRTGYLRKIAKRCSKIELFMDPGVKERCIRSWIIEYIQAEGSNVSLLSSIQMISHGTTADGSKDVVRPAAMFQYTPFELKKSVAHWMESSNGSPPPSLTDPDVALVTLDNAPLPGVLRIVNGKQYYWRNQGDGKWAPPQPVSRVPAVSSFARNGLAFMDMDASGTADLLVAAGESLPGYYENSGSTAWSRFVAYPRGHRASPFWSSEQVRLTDINGDGRIDAIMGIQNSYALWVNEGQEGWSDPMLVPAGDNDQPDLSDPLVFLADMTGDGLDDMVRVRSGMVEYWPGLGYGHYGEKQVMANSPRLHDLTPRPGHTYVPPVLLIDVDGDGCADLVKVASDGVTVCTNQNGVGFSSPVVLPDMPPPISGTVRAVNMKGHSAAGLVWNAPRGRQTGYVSLEFGSEEQPAYLLKHIENGSGLISEINYRSAVEDYCQDREEGIQWTTNFPFPYLVVAGTRETDIVSGRINEVQFHYHEAHFDAGSRQFQGFRRTERQEIGDESRDDTLTVFHFLMGQERLPGNGPEHAALNGMLWRTEIFALDGTSKQNQAYRREESDYAIDVLGSSIDGFTHTFVSVKNHRVEDIERSSNLRGEEKTYDYDAYGNVIRELHRGYGVKGGIAQTERIRVTEIAYAHGVTSYLVDKPCSIVIRDDGGTILSEERRYYDGPDFQGLSLGQVEKGLLSRKEQFVMNSTEFNQHYAGMNTVDLGYFSTLNADGETAFYVNSESYAYDTHGNKIAEKDALGHKTSYIFDSSALFRTTLSTSLGDTKFEVDRALGQPLKINYPDGTETLFEYDAQGRVLATALPTESLSDPPTTYVYNDITIPNSRTGYFRPTHNPVDDAVAVTYFDGHGKEFQQRAQTAPGQYVVSGLRLLNPWGDLKEEYEPTFDTNVAFAIPITTSQPSRQISYDALGRVIRIKNFNGGVSTAEYYPFEVVTRDSNDNDDSAENVARGQYNTPHLEEFDVFRYRVRTVEDLGGGQQMNYVYLPGPMGELLRVSDDSGEVAVYKYDRLGQRLQFTHREAGKRRIWYDAGGMVVRTNDDNGNDIHATIDSRRRLINLKLNDEVFEEYTYDDINRNALGRLSTVVYHGGSQTFEYDKLGRLAIRTYQFDNLTASQQLAYAYDRLGREISMSHQNGTQAGRTIQYDLLANGWVNAIPGFINQVQYNARGLPEQISYHNGVVSQTTYTSGPGRVATQSTITPTNQLLEQVSFEYDHMEMLLSSNDTAPGGRGIQNFAYDPLYQLRSTVTQDSGTPQTNQYEYMHNMNLSRFDEAGSTMDYDDPLHPNRVAGLTKQGAPRFDVSYDNNGNLLTLPGKTFQYNAKNELVRMETDSGLVAEYCYDHKGVRISKKVTDPQGIVTQTYFVGDYVEIRSTQIAYFVRLGKLRVAIHVNGETNFVHGDYLGSTAFFTDAAGTRIAAIAYRPFGNLASSNGVIDYRTFGVHPFDTESGLYYMRRRYYAPEIGRFLTPDPLALYQPTILLHNPKALHPYAFVANDPLNKSDMTGLSFWSVLGAIVGVIAAIVVAALVIMTGGLLGVLIGAALVIGLVAVSYVVASETAGTPFGEFMRGFLIGLNAGLNAILASVIFGPVVGVTLGVINFLAAFDTIANSSVYQGILGWSSWLMPMSWLATGVGLVFFLLNVIPVIFTGNQVEAVKIHSLSIDWSTGTIIMEGGWTYLSGFHGGYNLGNFAYVTPGSNVTDHETGHTLSVAAFGSIFHFIGAIDENAVQSTHADAYAERLADSHDPNATTDRSSAGEDPIIPIWV